MTREKLLKRIQCITGLTLCDPWGDVGTVWRVDLKRDSVWLLYDGLAVPFERPLELMVLAANGSFLTDRSRQFIKRAMGDDGMLFTFHYERGWAQSPPKAQVAVARSLDVFKKNTKRR